MDPIQVMLWAGAVTAVALALFAVAACAIATHSAIRREREERKNISFDL